MTSRDPIGRWGPYEAERRRAVARALIGTVIVLAGIAFGLCMSARYGLLVAP